MCLKEWSSAWVCVVVCLGMCGGGWENQPHTHACPALCCPPRPPPSSTHLQEAIAAEAWRAALSRAAGEKVLDDPKLLRRSIKREAADKARSAKKWQERVAAQQEAQRAQQDKCVFGLWGCAWGAGRWWQG